MINKSRQAHFAVNQTEQVNEEGEYLLMKQSLESLDPPLFYPSNSEIER